MRFWRSRTTLALILTIAALVVPCGAWYLVGSREVQRTIDQIEAAPRRFASDTALQLMERLQDRLQTLLQSESNRPFYQYQSLYHDPRVRPKARPSHPRRWRKGRPTRSSARTSKSIRSDA